MTFHSEYDTKRMELLEQQIVLLLDTIHNLAGEALSAKKERVLHELRLNPHKAPEIANSLLSEAYKNYSTDKTTPNDKLSF